MFYILDINFIMNSDPTNFLMPELHMVSNPFQLKQLQKKSLLEHYQKYMQQKQQHKKYHPQPQPQYPSASSQHEQNQKYYQQAIKQELNAAYQQELLRKEVEKQREKEKKMKEEAAVLLNIQRVKIQEVEKNKRAGDEFKREALSLLAEREQARKQQKRQELEEKHLYRNRYSLNTLSLQKQLRFEEHYKKVANFRQQTEKNYIQKVATSKKQEEAKKDNLIEAGIKRQKSLVTQQLEKQTAQQAHSRNSLKQTLIQQIAQKQLLRKQEQQRQREQGYTSPMYHSMHHVINNPVNFGMGRDNKYILKDFSQHGLARSGSQLLHS